MPPCALAYPTKGAATKQNAAAAALRLDPEEIAELDQLFEPSRIAGERYPGAGMLGVEE